LITGIARLLTKRAIPVINQVSTVIGNKTKSGTPKTMK